VPPGRPRQFDPEAALDAATRVFAEHGYEGASISQLTAAMGINRPSLYAAFGDKASLFRLVVERYAARGRALFAALEAEHEARRAVHDWLRAVAATLCSADCPRGCLIVQGALTAGEESRAEQDLLADRRAANERLLRRRLKRAVRAGQLPSSASARELAAYFSAVQLGMAVKARSGASRAELLRIAETAMRAWPPATRR